MNRAIYGGWGEEFYSFRLENLPGLRYEKIGGPVTNYIDMEVTDPDETKRRLNNTTTTEIYLLLPYGVALMSVRAEGTGGRYGSVTLFGEEDKVLEVERVISDARTEGIRLMLERQRLQAERADIERRLKEIER